MNQSLNTFTMTDSVKADLRKIVKDLPQVISLSQDFEFSSLLTSYGILREIGSPNDEIARFLFDAHTNEVLPLNSLRARLVKLERSYGVEIWSTATNSIDVKTYGVRELLHPNYSFNVDGTIKSLVIFPEAIAKIAKLANLDLVIVRDWALNSIFEGFDPKTDYYKTNFWELENNDTLLFAGLIKNRQLAFIGSHDFLAHVANAKNSGWDKLPAIAREVEEIIKTLIIEAKAPTLASLVLPYTAGVILDDLAQPPSYNSLNHQVVLNAVLASIKKKSIPSNHACTLSKFPRTFEHIILLSRTKGQHEYVAEEARRLVNLMVEEIRSSLVFENVDQSIGEKLFFKIWKRGMK